MLSAAAALVALTSAVLAYRSWRTYSGKEGMLLGTEADSRPEFVAVSGALLSTVFLLLILMTGGAMIFLIPARSSTSRCRERIILSFVVSMGSALAPNPINTTNDISDL